MTNKNIKFIKSFRWYMKGNIHEFHENCVSEDIPEVDANQMIDAGLAEEFFVETTKKMSNKKIKNKMINLGSMENKSL